MKERIIMWFWRKVPKSWLYWAVNQAWVYGSTTKYTDKHPDEITWSQVQKFLKE
jgi:hypothetical protein